MLKINNLTVELKSNNDHFYILRNISININKGEILGLAGESGSGKSVFARSLVGLNKEPIFKTNGEIVLEGKQIVTQNDFKSLRGSIISMIFQTPSLNPVINIGSQLTETLRIHNKKMSKKAAFGKAVELLKNVEIDNPEERMSSFPHQLSGGMNQRVMIAIALASNPRILIADEPTTALDVSIQAQIIKLLIKLNIENDLSTLFISHDLSLLSSICARIAVLYSGELMEITSGNDLINNNLYHPYTKALKDCIPHIHTPGKLNTIKGSIGKNDDTKTNCCIFSDRCERVKDKCKTSKPHFNGRYACFYPLICEAINE